MLTKAKITIGNRKCDFSKDDVPDGCAGLKCWQIYYDLGLESSFL